MADTVHHVAATLAAARLNNSGKHASISEWVDEYLAFVAELTKRAETQSEISTAEYLEAMRAINQ